MNRWPIRLRLAVWSGTLTLALLVLFGIGSAWNLYHEQLDALTIETHKPSAKEKTEALEIVGDLMRGYLVLLPVASVLAAAGSWWIAGQALRPLHDVTAAAECIHAQSLDQRIPEPASEDEVRRLTIVLNSMLDRLRRSFEQARHFAADASHELKTPLTIMRGEIEEQIRQCPPSDTERATFLERLLGQTQRLAAICTDLLFLARLDAGNVAIDAQPIDLTALCEELADDSTLIASERGIRMDTNLASNVWISGDPSSIHRALLNLLQNAIQYNEPNGSVRMQLLTDKQAIVRIENTGPGIPESEIANLFTRFHRGANHRGQTAGHGLGLNICREIVLQAGGHVALVHSRPGSTLFEVRLPIS